MLNCDRCKNNGATKTVLKIPKANLNEYEILSYDICEMCCMTLAVRLLDRLPREERILFVQQFMRGIIL